jgi:hypothetical protein
MQRSFDSFVSFNTRHFTVLAARARVISHCCASVAELGHMDMLVSCQLLYNGRMRLKMNREGSNAVEVVQADVIESELATERARLRDAQSRADANMTDAATAQRHLAELHDLNDSLSRDLSSKSEQLAAAHEELVALRCRDVAAATATQGLEARCSAVRSRCLCTHLEKKIQLSFAYLSSYACLPVVRWHLQPHSASLSAGLTIIAWWLHICIYSCGAPRW